MKIAILVILYTCSVGMSSNIASLSVSPRTQTTLQQHLLTNSTLVEDKCVELYTEDNTKKGSHIISRQLFQQNEFWEIYKEGWGWKKQENIINKCWTYYCHILKQEGFFKAFLCVYSRKATHKRTRVVVSCEMYSPVPHNAAKERKNAYLRWHYAENVY